MNLINCVWCGEVMDTAKSPYCPGCGAFHKPEDAPVRAELAVPPKAPLEKRREAPLQFSPTRREVEQDSKVLVVVLTIVGVLVIIPAMAALAANLGIPWLYGLLAAAVVYAGMVAVVEKNDRQQREADRARVRRMQALVAVGDLPADYVETQRPSPRSAAGVVLRSPLHVARHLWIDRAGHRPSRHWRGHRAVCDVHADERTALRSAAQTLTREGDEALGRQDH